ncbi:MAG TPA: hypothetical protein VD704_02505 [Gaiellaceae bacterium]|nr:hypothetical protein [Gaiellaceae bacterium]
MTWQVSDPAGIKIKEGCERRTVRRETTGTEVTCRATNTNGITIAVTVTVRIDKRPPRVRPRGTRPPDANGWYNHRVEFTAGGRDSASGIAWCTRIPAYSGPDGRRIRVKARCGDVAGRTARGTRTFKYDGTPPRGVRAVRGRPPDKYGWYGDDLRIHFVGRDGLSGLARCSSHVYRGPDTPRARVRGGCRDRAGNVRQKTVRFKFSKPLLVPRNGARRPSPPVLDWVDVGKARRYNVQLWLDGRKVLSRWPTESRYPLRSTWTYGGAQHRLHRGERYTWYVWPLFARGYGELLGRSTFTLVRRDDG